MNATNTIVAMPSATDPSGLRILVKATACPFRVPVLGWFFGTGQPRLRSVRVLVPGDQGFHDAARQESSPVRRVDNRRDNNKSGTLNQPDINPFLGGFRPPRLSV